MNAQLADMILQELRGLKKEQQLTLLDYLKVPECDQETLDAVFEAVESDMCGTCDNCDKYGILRNGEACGMETAQCAEGCEK